MKKASFLIIINLIISNMHAQHVGIGTTTPVNMLSVAGTMDVSGNIGVGVANPIQKLEVNGDAVINDLTLGRGPLGNETNTVLGISSLNQSTGINNTAFGYLGLSANTTGSGNTAFGAYALNSNQNGDGNTAIGRSTMSSQSYGLNNTAIGYNARPEHNNLTNATAIGANAVVSASNSMVLGNNVNVGIGNSSPSAKLDVGGTSKAVNVQITNGSANNLILKSDATGLASWVASGSIETDPKVGVLNANRIPFWSGSQLVNSSITDDGTNIGIGTTAPGAKLDIVSANAALRLLSGNLSNNTSIQIGRTATDGSLGVAASANQYAIGAATGDIILRNESATNRLIINNGAGTSSLVVTNGKVGIQTKNPVNRLDIRQRLAVGTSYSGTNTAPTNGMIVQGILGIGTTDPFGVLRVANGFPKTENVLHHIAFWTSNEALSNSPFGLRFSILGNATLDGRVATMQTTDVNQVDGGNLILQPDTGHVSIGNVWPPTELAVKGGISTKYSNSHVITLNDTGENSNTYDITINPPLPSDWDYTNTVFLVTISDGAKGVIRQAKILDSGNARLWISNSNPGLTRINYIIFRM